MANTLTTEATILHYIDTYTTEEVKYRGERLYSMGTAEFKVYEENTDTWKFFVKDTQTFRLTIRGIKNDNIETSCSCPYGWGGVCKHTVAALLFIADRSSGREMIEKDQESEFSGASIIRNSTGGSNFELTNYELITPDFINDNISARVLNQLSYYTNFITLISVDITNNRISFLIENDGNEVTVEIFSENGKVYISTTEYSQSGQLTTSIAYCLKLIANSNTPGMLGDIFSDKLIEREKEILSNFGFSQEADFETYFYHAFDLKHGLTIERTEETIGAVPLVNKEIDPYTSFINKTSSDELVLESLFSKKEQRDIGFILRLESDEDTLSDDSIRDHYNGETNQFYNIIPIIGKTNKTGKILNGNIEEYHGSSDFQIQKNESTKELLDILEDIQPGIDGPVEFQQRKRAYKNLVKEKFIFGLKPNLYNIKKSNLQPIDLSPIPMDIVFDIWEDVNFIYAELKIKIGDEVLNYTEVDTTRSTNEICVIKDVFYFTKNYKVSQYIANYPGKLKMVKTHKFEFFEKVILPISKDFEINFDDNTFLVETIELDFNKKQVYLSEQDEFIVISPQVEYDNGFSALLHSSGNILVKSDENIFEYKRNQELEEDFIDSLAELHPNFEAQKSRRVFYLHFSNFAENMWFYKFFDKLKHANVEVYGLNNLKNFKYSPYKGKINTAIASGQDWFEVSINVSFGDNKVSIADIRKAVINKQRYIQLNDGSVGVLPADWFLKLEKYFRNGEIKDDKLAISKLKFSIIDELFENIDDVQLIQELAEKRNKLATFTEIAQTEVPEEVTATLRHYQKEGLNWLNFLEEMQWGGILADDMGLGKTLQILTFLQYLNNKQTTTSLIVVPTTLLFNWENEIAKFTPNLKAFYHYGIDRQRDVSGFENYHIIFTTYGILLRDIEMLREFNFNYVILDESQAIKNPASRRYKAANLINAKNRIALSGTPIENGTFDLFAQMSFANRGFFNAAKAFKDNFSNPIDKDGNEAIAGELQKLINPFILRRTKEKVATELPDKTEDIIYCEMESEQRQVYDAYRNDYKNQLLTKIQEDGVGKSKMMVLEALTRLRQICDSPALINKDHITDAQSIKVKEIIRHITNKTADHKILIFSQFVKMLTIVKNELSRLNIEFEYLDGKSTTKQREKSVSNFQEKDDLRVFLISLKAGGTGLNLTAADYVYILDPWWNPAVENQAIDRCYRIGQNKKVFAYRMICKNTVEEKIVNLQNKKKKIAGDIIQTDENIMKTLDVNDIQELFS